MFEVHGVVIHQIPRRPSQADIRAERAVDSSPLLTDAETDLTPEFQHYLENKIKISVASAAFPVVFLDGAETRVPAMIEQLLDSIDLDNTDSPPTGFIGLSRDMAWALHSAQTATPPEGLLAVVRGAIRGRPLAAILKLEREEGLRLEREEVDGRLVMKAIVERDLVMTESTKVFKTGLFSLADGAQIDGWVTDEQAGSGAGKLAADFFVNKFLGCKLVDLPEVLTKKFLETSERYFNRSVADPEEQAEYLRAVLTELKSNRTQVQARNFAETYLHGDHRSGLVAELDAKGVPVASFPKDNSLIESRLREVRIRFKSGISVSIAQALFDDGTATLVHDDSDDPKVATLTVRDRVDAIRSSGR